MKINPYLLFLLFSVSFFMSSCAKEEDRNNDIPQSRVEIDINFITEHQFDNPYYYKKYYTGQNAPSAGYIGVLAISLHDTNGSVTLRAFELCCPYEAPIRNELNIIEDNWTLQCPKCNSQYSLIDEGRPTSGPASTEGKRLRRYNVYKDAVFYRIRN